MENTKVYIINGVDDEGTWNIEIYSTHKKALDKFNEYVNDFADMYDCNVEVDNDYATYDSDNHYGRFWVEERYIF